RSYGANLQSSFTSVLSSALEYSSRLPVSVLVRLPRGFLGRPSGDIGILNALRQSSKPTPLPDGVPLVRGERGNINPLSVGYASRPGLRHRLTLGGFTFPRNP